MKNLTERRKFLKLGAGTAGAFLFSNTITKAFASACGLTPPQTPGPFYPGEAQFHADNDLTQIAGHASSAQGEVVFIQGQVLGVGCKPLSGATVEIWQACATGRYNNPNDPNPAALDPDFKYWGETVSDAQGRYSFKTIIPGAYPADTNWMRPPHVHFKVSRLGYHELVTQMYFKGNEYNDADLILKDVPADERDRVIVEFDPATRVGTFDITMRSVR